MPVTDATRVTRRRMSSALASRTVATRTAESAAYASAASPATSPFDFAPTASDSARVDSFLRRWRSPGEDPAFRADIDVVLATGVLSTLTARGDFQSHSGLDS